MTHLDEPIGQGGNASSWQDSKRYWWLLGGMIAYSIPWIAIGAYLVTGGAAWTVLIIPLIVFGVIPTLDAIVGTDRSNPPEEAVAGLMDDPFYMQVARILAGVGVASMVGALIFIGSQPLPLWAMLAAMIGLGYISGGLITLGHELGHKTDKTDRLFAKIALGAVGYGHFTAEHNLGHHKNVSTPEDCASGRMGESVYQFALRELPGALVGGWQIEANRLKKRGHSVWSHHNEILQANAIGLVLGVIILAIVGWQFLPFLLLHHATAWYALTMVNYIEHYGLLRQKLDNGRYEPCQPHHSWNTNHRVSNILQIHLQRHSDHHTHPMRPYQALRDFENLPSLPSGYPGSLALAAIPPLWFKVMDPKVVNWAGGDLSKVNMHEPARDRLTKQFG